ncbi:MAG TPA: DUF1338 domain-containing protein, partial [Burkholderiaceae bacterium]|nr:DUF1338 domain-containing protein [Burkholderiaceae bacterium]
MMDTALFRLLASAMGENAARETFAQLEVAPALLKPAGETVSRGEMAQALNMALFRDVTLRVPAAAAYVADQQRAGQKL